MTHIIEGFKTKKALKLALESGETVSVIDPALHDSWCEFGRHFTLPDGLPEGGNIVATNHPKRSWFASITKHNGKVVVK